MSSAYVEAAQAAATRSTTTSTAPPRTASATTRSRCRDGRRCSAAVAYLHPAMERPNLTVETAPPGPPRRVRERPRGRRRRRAPVGADRAARRARGDPRGGHLQLAAAADAVGHRAGRAARLLLIDVVLDQPLVGQNLQDHANAGGVWLHAPSRSACCSAIEPREHRAVDRGGPRPAGLERRRGRRLRAHASTACPRPTSSSTRRPACSPTRA